MRRYAQFLCLLAVTSLGMPQFGKASDRREVRVQSPDGKVQLALVVAEDGKKVLFSVDRDGRPVVEPSLLDVRLAGAGWIADGASIENVDERTIDDERDLPWGKASRLRDHCRAATVRLKSKSGTEWDVELRAYNDGAALRYGLPKQDRVDDFVIEEEATEFRLAGDPSVLFMTLDHFTTSHEALYDRKPLSELPQDKLIEMPVLAVWNDGRAAAITEASLRNFAGMYLEKRPISPGNEQDEKKNEANESPSRQPSPVGRGSILRSRLAPLPDDPKAAVKAKAPHWSPWRVVMAADHAGQLIESNLLLCLNEPAKGDFSWVKPGKTTFHWWNGMVENGAPSTPETNFLIHKRYIDFCAKNKIEYHSVISVAGNRPWFVQRDPGFGAPHPDTDILTPRTDIDLPRILDYAKKNGVEIRFWVHWKPLSEHLEEAFALYERWGIKGLMVDFMDRDDQEMVEWQEKVLESAARHKLHIQFHGSYKPTGEHVTYPNLFNREGVLNLEYLKWSDSCAPPHSVNVAYTRGLAGITDFHLGGFRAASRDEFQARDEKPMVLGTRSYLLAMYVVFENPMPMVADHPSAYEGQPGFDFIVDVPTTWDETRFVAGEAGEYVVVARRSGKDWYLGGITNWTPRELKLPLDFLGKSSFAARLYMDDSLDGQEPNSIREAKREVSGSKTLDVSLAPGGGVAAIFTPTQ